MPFRRHKDPVVQPPIVIEPSWWRAETHGLAHWWVMGGNLEDGHFPLPDIGPGHLPNMFIVGAVLSNVDFSGLAFDALYFAGSTVDNCRFNAVSLQRVGFGSLQYHRDWRFPIDWSHPLTEESPRYRETVFTGCTFADSKLPRHNTRFGNVRFERCVFHDVLRSTIIAPLWTHHAEFIACTFTGRLSCVVFEGEVRPGSVRRLGRATCEILGNDFSAATLKSVEFRGVDLEAQTFPRGFTAGA